MASGQPQFGSAVTRERPGGKVLHPVTLAGEERGRRERHQPLELVLGIGLSSGARSMASAAAGAPPRRCA